ncbi:MAG: hypothetical protein U9Q06_04110 [Nanoarchaeota archaeon]|nr:hypothetical protein [Nanoarchaeota archaeon]
MKRIIISGIAGFFIFFVGTMVTGNPILSLIFGIVVFVVLSMITDENYMKRQKRRRDTKDRERKEEKQWRRESYHKEYGRQKAKDDSEKERKHNDYDEFDIGNIIPKTNPLKKLWGN